jgi:hypothetical protein
MMAMPQTVHSIPSGDVDDDCYYEEVIIEEEEYIEEVLDHSSSGEDESSSGEDESSSGEDESSSGEDESSSGEDESSSDGESVIDVEEFTEVSYESDDNAAVIKTAAQKALNGAASPVPAAASRKTPFSVRASTSRKTASSVPAAVPATVSRKTASKPAAVPNAEGATDEVTTFYSATELLKGAIPGLDYKNREKYLAPDEFESVFKMSKEEFAAMPKWKQTKEKRKVKMF